MFDNFLYPCLIVTDAIFAASAILIDLVRIFRAKQAKYSRRTLLDVYRDSWTVNLID